MVPAFSFIKGVEEQGEILDVWLHIEVILPFVSLQGSRLTDHKWTNQTRVKVPLLYETKKLIENVCYMNQFLNVSVTQQQTLSTVE